MKIHESPVSYNTPLRDAQVKLMAQWCRKLQVRWDDSHTGFGLEADWIERECVQDFFLTAEACGFVCKEWGVMEGLSNTVVHWNGVPGGAEVKWLRYFIHSLILHDKKAVENNMAYMESMTFEMGKKQGYADLAAALETQLSA